jgi:hypothetical protein
LHQYNDNCGSRDGHHRVHDDAELAVIRVGIAGVQVRNLSDSQKRQQDQAQARDDRQKAAPGGVLPAEMGLKNCQTQNLYILILQKNALIWTPGLRTSCLRP